VCHRGHEKRAALLKRSSPRQTAIALSNTVNGARPIVSWGNDRRKKAQVELRRSPEMHVVVTQVHPFVRQTAKNICKDFDGRKSSLLGRLSTMAQQRNKIELLRGTLDMLILRTLQVGPAHGHQIAKHIQHSTDHLLQIEHGSLYPALHRLERKGWLVSKWDSRDGRRELKYYSLTALGKKQLSTEESKWQQLVRAIAKVTARVES
jgi:transcriptional regulator